MADDVLEPVRLDGVGPIYEQIRRAIRERILSGDWPPGTAVPAEHALMQRLGTSRMTVHRALVELQREGLITRRRRSGTIVAEPAASHAMLDIPSIPEEIARLGQAHAFEVLARREGVASPEIAARFDVPRRRRVLWLSVMHWAGGAPHVLEERLIHLATVPAAADESFATVPPGTWLLRNSVWTQAEHAIGAVAAEAEVAERLQLQTGAPCLLVERRTWIQNEPVTAVRLTYPGGSHKFVGRFGPYGAV
jgi:GntR family histidine utilization transcriptional repressor